MAEYSKPEAWQHERSGHAKKGVLVYRVVPPVNTGVLEGRAGEGSVVAVGAGQKLRLRLP